MTRPSHGDVDVPEIGRIIMYYRYTSNTINKRGIQLNDVVDKKVNFQCL